MTRSKAEERSTPFLVTATEGSTASSRATWIANGIEWFSIANPDGYPDEDCQCARCGSSCMFSRCGNCDHGEVYHDPWDGCGDGYYVRCQWCDGKGGAYHCISGPEWCNANPIVGREHIESTAMISEAWDV